MTRYVEKMTPIEEALRLMKGKTARVSETLRLPVWEGVSLIIASDIVMPHDYPPRPKSAYDGYAVRSDDTPGRLRVVGEAPIGVTDVRLRVSEGEAVYVTTGAYLPEGADAVVPEEKVGVEGGYVVVGEKYQRWANVDPPGAYIRRGDVVIPKGTLLTPFDMVALLDVGVTEAEFYRPVRVAFLETGNELFKPSDPETVRGKVLEGLVVATTGELVSWFIEKHLPWVKVVEKVALPDNLDTLLWYIGRLLDRVDAVFVTGGTGPSEIDLFHRLPEALGGELVFRGLFVQGGRPTSGVVVKGKPIIGLSGYPISALHGFIRLAYPLLAYMGNASTLPPLPLVWARLTEALNVKRPRPIKVRLHYEGGVLHATPLRMELQNSSATIAFAWSDGIALTMGRGYGPGDEVLVYAYRLPAGYHQPSISF